MDNIDFGQSITFMIGVRVEKEDNTYQAKFSNTNAAGTGNVITVDPKFITDTTMPFQTTIWLPNAQLTLKPTDYLTLRFAAYQALARPDFNLRLPQFSYSTALVNGCYPIYAGNPGLKDVTSSNFEVNTQIFNGTLGLISVNAYYKRIENLYHSLNAIRFEWGGVDSTKLISNNGVKTPLYQAGYHRLDEMLSNIGLSDWTTLPAFKKLLHTYSNFNVTTGYNSPDPSYAWGFELEHQMNFRFIPVKWLQNFVLTYNISIARSETNVYKETSSVDTVYTPAIMGTDKFGRPIEVSPENYNGITVHYGTLLKKPMEDQPQFTSNVSLGYDVENWGSSVRISMFYQSKYTRTYSADGTSDGIIGEFIKWDLSVKQQVTSNISLMLNVDNIFNRTETRFRYNNIFDWGYLPTASSSYGTTVDFGVLVSL